MNTDFLANIDRKALGERLKEARKARGLTQEDVAKQLNILRTTLVAIEKGDRKISSSELISIAKLYARPVGEFLSKREHKEPFIPQFRLSVNSQNVEEKELMAAVLDLENLARDYVELEELNTVSNPLQYPSTYNWDVPGVTPEQRAEEIAMEERTRLGLGDGPIADLRSILEEAVGIRVFYIGLPAKVGGLFAYNDQLGACIAINRKHPPTRSNWSLAHEYAHFLSTRYQVDVNFINNHWGKINAERFADAFAKNFLMPRTGVSRRLSESVQAHKKGITIGDVMAVANLYHVSAEAMFRRLEELKRLPSGTWDNLRNRQFSPDLARTALGLNEDERQSMLPLRYKLLALSAYDEKDVLTEGQVAQKLRLDRVKARVELEKLRQTADDSSGDYAPLNLNPAESIVLA